MFSIDPKIQIRRENEADDDEGEITSVALTMDGSSISEVSYRQERVKKRLRTSLYGEWSQ